MMFLNRIFTNGLFIFLTIYKADSYKWQTKELDDYSISPVLRKGFVEPLSYKIFLRMPSAEVDVTFSGDSRTFIIVNHAVTQIMLNAYGLTIKQETFLQKNIYRYPYKKTYYIQNVVYLDEIETLIIYFVTEIPSGFYEIYMEFIGNISENETGLYRTTSKDSIVALRDKYETSKDSWIFMTQLKPAAARQVFPCWDEPAIRTRFAIGIEHHRNYTILSNMPIWSDYNIKDEMKRTHFESTPPIPAYLVAFALTDFDCSTIKENDFTTRVCSTSLVKQEQMTYALNTSAKVIAHLQFHLNISSQFPEITHIGLPDFSYETAGNWGLNIYRENNLIYNETLHPIDHKLNVSMYVSSLVALQWVGHFVSPTSWTHMWFSQTLALFYGVKAFNEIYDDKDITSLFTYRLQSRARENNVVSQVKPLMYPTNNHDEIDRLFKSSHFTNCLKEYAIIAMLEDTVTKSVFHKATIAYLEKYQFSTATPNAFWDILQERADSTHPSIQLMVQSWFEQRNLPIIMVTRNHTDDLHDKIVFKPRYNGTRRSGHSVNNGIPVKHVMMSFPENISSIDWMDFKDMRRIFRMIAQSECVIFNWQYTGYYRVQYDNSSLNILTKYLKSEERTKIHVLNRAHIIEDAYYFWMEGKFNISMFLNLIRFMSNEEQCAPWYAMQNIMRKIWPFLNIDIGTHAKSIIVDVLSKLLLKVGYMEYSDDTECVKFKRLLATKWACRLRHLPCLQIASLKLLAHLGVPELKTIMPMWEEWTYCNGLLLSENWVWYEVLEEYHRAKNKRILEYFACSKNITFIRDYLKLAMSDNSVISNIYEVNSEDRRNIYLSIVRKHISNNEVLDYILRKMIRMEINDKFIENISYIIENVYSRLQLEKISEFLNKNLKLDRVFNIKLIYKMDNQLSQITKWESLVNRK